jgi:hypothetical protein
MHRLVIAGQDFGNPRLALEEAKLFLVANLWREITRAFASMWWTFL